MVEGLCPRHYPESNKDIIVHCIGALPSGRITYTKGPSNIHVHIRRRKAFEELRSTIYLS